MSKPFTIERAVRKQIPGLFMFWGPSASGKTYSALRFARGLVGDDGKICVIDTENRRSLFYAGAVGGHWDFVDFQPDFTTQRYIEVIRQVEQAGYDAILIDSFSHVWQGEGGVLDEADKNNANGLAKWAKPKMALKRLVNVALRAKCHVIFCLRSKMGVVQTGSGRDMKILSSGLAPIMEKGLIYEMMISILFGPDHKPMFQNLSDRFFVDPHIPAVKAPAGLIELIKPGEHVTEATGAAVKQWLDGGQRDVLDEARRIASRGSVVFREQWKLWSQSDREQLRPFTQEFQTIAARADEEIARENDPQTWEEAIPEEAGLESEDASEDALTSGFDTVPAQEPEQPSEFQSPATTQAPATQTTPPLATTATPAHLSPVQAIAIPPATQTAQFAQRSAPAAPPPVTPPPRRASAPQAKPSAQPADSSAPNLF
ncbi:MAG: AAA family ATPase [Magnetococcales bacterium]|nr:AAA family ATPase [Magnetococcales bacterium]